MGDRPGRKAGRGFRGNAGAQRHAAPTFGQRLAAGTWASAAAFHGPKGLAMPNRLGMLAGMEPNNKLKARDVRAGMVSKLKLGRVMPVAKIVSETHPCPGVGPVLTFVSPEGFRASFKSYGDVEVLT